MKYKIVVENGVKDKKYKETYLFSQKKPAIQFCLNNKWNKKKYQYRRYKIHYGWAVRIYRR